MSQSNRQHASRRGLTLIEAVVSLSIISVLVLGLSSSVMLGVHAIPAETELGVADREVHDLCNMFRSDVEGAYEIAVQVAGNTTRVTLKMTPTGSLGQGTSVLYEFIGDASMIRRRVDARSYSVLTTSMDKYRFTTNSDSGMTRYVKLELQFDDTIQQRFELFIPTPYRPTLK